MSLEAKIELLTAAVVELTRVIQLQSAPDAAPTLVRVADTAIVEEIPNESPELGKSSPTTDTSPPSSTESPAVSYDDVKAVTIAVSKIDKAKAVAGLARFGAKNAKELTEEQWSDYVAYMKRVGAGEIDPESSHE